MQNQMLASLPHHHHLFSLCICLLLFGSKSTGVSLGAIVDASSRIGKQERIAMQMAIDDFYKINNTTTNRPLLHIRNSGGSPVQAALADPGSYKAELPTFLAFPKIIEYHFKRKAMNAAMDLIENQKVQAIVGLRSFDEATFVGELGSKSQVPILSFVGTAPTGAFQRWPFLVQATQPKYSQMKAIAAVIATWKWRKVNFLYEEISSATATIIPPLVSALQEVDCEIELLVPLPPQHSQSLSKQLEKLREEQCRVFIVHASLSLASRLFIKAKKMGLMEDDSVWITTDVLTDLLDSANSSVISSMQGVIGIKSYFPQTGERFKDFFQIFQRKYRLEYANEFNSRTGIFALRAYDAVWAVALAMEARTTKIKSSIENSTNVHQHRQEDPVVIDGQRLLAEISSANFEGLTGKFRIIEGDDDHRQLDPVRIFQIVNVVGKSYKEVGFWSEQSGFSRFTSSSTDQDIDLAKHYNNTSSSMKILGEIFWPGGSLSVPRGWALPSSKNPLIIGVPGKSAFTQFVNVVYNFNGTTKPKVTGLAINIFEEALQLLPYKFPYDFIPYEGTYDSLVDQISKEFGAVVGDTSIVAYRCEHTEFSHPWSDSGIQMVVYQKSLRSNKAWLFIIPFTKSLWALTVAINIFNGLVIWLIERTHNPEFTTGSLWNQIGTLIWLAFSTLFAQHGDRLHSNLSRMIMVVWLFVAFIIIQSYTASLTTLLTVPQLKQSLDISELKNQVIGCDGGSFIFRYLVDVLHFSPKNIKTMSSYEDYPEALQRGEIAAAFLNVPHVKVFLSKYCKDFVVIGPTYRIGGFGFAFPRRSPMLPDISKAVLQLIESGRVQQLENEIIRSNNCSRPSDFGDVEGSLDLTSFWGLFMITGGTSIVSLMVFVLSNTAAHKRQSFEHPLIEPSFYNVNNVHHPLVDELYMFAPELDTQEEHICSLESQDTSR